MRAATIAVTLVILAAGIGFTYWQSERGDGVAAGLAKANGRIEVERVAIASKYPGRIAELRVEEGDFVTKGTLVARMDTAELLAEIAVAKAEIRRAEQTINRAKADVMMKEADLRLAEVDLKRAVELEKRKVTPTAELDRRRALRDVAVAALAGAKAGVGDAEAAKAAAEAEADRLNATLADMSLIAPVQGRVEYKLAQTGEVLSAGGQVVTLLDLSDVYMTIFLPTGAAGRVGIGSEARIVLDAAPEFVIPATVSFVAAEAQFTPKFVETSTEREKLMYRIKLRIDPRLLETYRDYVKAGLTGDAYVKLSAAAIWPAELTPKLPPKPADAQ